MTNHIPWNNGKSIYNYLSKAKIIKILKNNNYHYGNTAKELNCSYASLQRLIKKYNIIWDREKTQFENKSKVKSGINHYNYGKKLSKKHKNNIKKNSKGYWKGKKIPINIRLKISKTLKQLKIDRGYIVSEKSRIKIRKKMIKKIEKTKGKFKCFYSEKACIFFNKLNNKYKLNGQHALNKGEYHVKELGYFLDFYSEKYNIVIEWNEHNHYNNNRLTAKHITRQEQIKRKLKCNWINIKQDTFKEENIFKRIEKIIRQKELRITA